MNALAPVTKAIAFSACFAIAAPLLATADFKGDVKPVLEKHCIECHGAKKQKAELRLDLRAAAFKGGNDGVVIVPGKSSDSLLVQRITSDDPDEQMPPKGERLTADEIAAVRAWIDAGAVWVESPEEARDPRLDHWAWQPVKKQAPGGSIDTFISAKLAEKNLRLSPEADRRTLCRRLYFDLTGLPPAPEEVAAFVADPAPDAYERLVDRLLASPHYGERWARDWLDIAHMADTHGFERDQRRDNAWPYRDYVIRAFNSDKRYDEFLREQIAGDILRPTDPEAVVATGFLAAGPWDVVGQLETKSDALKRQARADDLDDMLTQVMAGACALTVNCARCHDHKLDPISQREYYAVSAVFAGVRRGERPVPPGEAVVHASQELRDLRVQMAKLSKQADLADIVGGGDGYGTGEAGGGIDQMTGQRQKDPRGVLTASTPNQFVKSALPFIDGVVIPDGGDGTVEVPITSTGLTVHGVPATSRMTWDAIRNGPLNNQYTTTLGGTDFTTGGHTLLGLHANAAITFDLAAIRQAGAPAELRLRANAGYFGMTPKQGASFRIYVDGELKVVHEGIGHDDGLIPVDVALPATAHYLTLMSTDGGNGISHDQISFGDAHLEPAEGTTLPDVQAELERLRGRSEELEGLLKAQARPEKVYAVTAETPPPVHLFKRGDPERPAEIVTPGAVSCVAALPADFGDLPEGARRVALANWITDPANPLTRRVIVNRLWQYHFGVGLVDTPSDFGLGGGKPTHPELLDWLAEEFAAHDWSIKAMHRLICLSATYRQQSNEGTQAAGSAGHLHALETDGGNRLLWRMNPRRLEAEALRDTVLTVSGKMNGKMFGPGYRDFDYEEEYAPVYRTITDDRPELWRRSVYRFVVRTTPDRFLTTLDCPNPASITATRNVTTTALQSLSLLNNDFMLRQAGYFAERVRAEAGEDPAAQVSRAFGLAFGRVPTPTESAAAAAFVKADGLPQLCRMIFNANEFVYVD